VKTFKEAFETESKEIIQKKENLLQFKKIERDKLLVTLNFEKSFSSLVKADAVMVM